MGLGDERDNASDQPVRHPKDVRSMRCGGRGKSTCTGHTTIVRTQSTAGSSIPHPEVVDGDLIDEPSVPYYDRLAAPDRYAGLAGASRVGCCTAAQWRRGPVEDEQRAETLPGVLQNTVRPKRSYKRSLVSQGGKIPGWIGISSAALVFQSTKVMLILLRIPTASP